MHWTGKVCLGLVILLAGLDAYFALVLIAHRDRWNQRYETALGNYESQHAQLLQARRNVRDRQYQLDRLQNEWGSFWDGVGGGVLNAGDARLRLEAGFAAGLPQQRDDGTNPLVYVFQDNGENGSTFLGEFELVTVEGDQSGARLTRPAFGMEVAGWPADGSGAQFRIRHSVPASTRSLFDNLFVQYPQEERALDFQQRQLRIQDEQLAQSQSILDQRIAELSGDPDPPEGAGQDVIDGLVETIRREEVARNADLETLYNLRRQYQRKTIRLSELIAENRQSVAALPGAEDAASRPAQSAAVPATVPTTTSN